MASSSKPIPDRLTNDAIVEAVFEIRFNTPTLVEALIGRLSDFAPWQSFIGARLPAAQIPDAIRQTDGDLRYTAIFELNDKERNRSVHIGPHVLSYHQRAPYVGWAALHPELRRAAEGLFEKTKNAVDVQRLGLRYINALHPEVHKIGSLRDLDLKLVVDDQQLVDHTNLNFTTFVSDSLQSTVRIATPDFISGGNLPSGTSLLVDIDVFTGQKFRTKSAEDVKGWIEQAHSHEKQQFFTLFTREKINALSAG